MYKQSQDSMDSAMILTNAKKSKPKVKSNDPFKPSK